MEKKKVINLRLLLRSVFTISTLAVFGCITEINRHDSHLRDVASLYQKESESQSPERVNDIKLATPMTQELSKNWQALKERQLRLLPVPKKLDFTGKEIDVKNIAIVVKKNDETGKIAANEIVTRIEELSGKKPPILNKEAEDRYNIVIENIYPNTFTKDDSSSNIAGGDQAYGLYPKKNSIVLAGRGKQGTLWAAVTARWLLEQKDGKTIFYPARITDWPDYRWREVERARAPYMERDRNDPEQHFRTYKPYVDYIFRLKCNLMDQHCYQPFQGAFSPFKTEPDVPPTIVKSIRKVNDYARARGIKPNLTCMLNLGKKPYQKSPELENVFLMPYHNTYVSWARTDLHRERAKKLLKYCQDAGYDMVSLHAPDGGGFMDPEMWSYRDADSRKLYPTDKDRPKADWNVVKQYYDILRPAGIDVLCINYPYSINFLSKKNLLQRLDLPDTPATSQEAEKIISRIEWDLQANNKLYAKDIPFVLREDASTDYLKDLARYLLLCPERKVLINNYISEYCRDMMELLPREAASFRTMYSSAAIGIKISNENRCFTEPVIACGAEYIWNTAFPGWSNLQRDNGYFMHGPPPPQWKLDIMAERAATGLWGAKAGKELKNVFNSMLSIEFALNPEERQKRLNLKNIPTLYKANHEALLRAEKAFDRTWKQKEDVEKNGGIYLDSFSHPFFTQYYLMIKGTVPYSITNGAIIKARTELDKGNLDAAGEILTLAQKDLENSEREFKRISVLLKNHPILWPHSEVADKSYWSTLAKIRVLNPEFSKLSQRLKDLFDNREDVYLKNSIPNWFSDYLKHCDIYVVPVKARINLDGTPDETTWNSICAVEYFAETPHLVIPPFPVSMKMFYSNDTLYFSGHITQPLVSEIEDTKHDISKYVPNESVELFLVPSPRKPNDFYQVILDISGNLFTQHCFQSTSAPYEHKENGIDLGIKSATNRTKDGWTFELSIPFSKLNAQPGNGWKGMFAYNRISNISPRKINSYASSIAKTKSNIKATASFLDPKRYSPLIFTKNVPEDIPVVEIKCAEFNLKDQVHSSGTGTLVTFKPEIQSRQPLKDVSVEATFIGKDKKSLGRMPVKEIPYMPFMWLSPTPLQYQLEKAHKGVSLVININYKRIDGKEFSKSKQFILGDAQAILTDKDIFKAFDKSDEKALALEAFFETITNDGTQVLDMKEGEISFMFMPQKSFNANTPHCLFHAGPVRKNTPLSYNQSSIIALIEKNMLIFSITNKHFKLRSVSAPLPPLKYGQWTKLSFQWNMDDKGKTRMAIFANDKKITNDKVRTWGGKDGSSPLPIKDEKNIMMQMGCLNSGFWLANGFFKNFTITNKNKEEISFNFNGSLDGSFSSNEKRKARIGNLSQQL